MNPIVNRLSARSLRVADLEAIYLAEAGSSAFVRWAVAALDHLDQDEMWYSLWLLRRSARAKSVFPDYEIRRLLAISEGVQHWASRVTYCQMMAAVNVPQWLNDEFFSAIQPFLWDRLSI